MTVALATRADTVDHLTVTLPQRASLLTRLIFRHGLRDLSRSETGILSTLSRGPQRITALAELESLAQPTVTLLVKGLLERGFVQRGRDQADGRVVLVSLTEAGRTALEQTRARYRPRLRAGLDALTDEQLVTLQRAGDVLVELIDSMQLKEAP